MFTWTLGRRISLGFAAVTGVTLALGGLAIWQMKIAAHNSHALSKKYVPEAAFAAHLNGAMAATNINIRTFGLTGGADYLQKGRAACNEVRKHFQELKQLSEAFPELEKLRAVIGPGQQTFEQFVHEIDETERLMTHVSAIREAMNAAAADCVRHLETLQKAQIVGLKSDVRAEAEARELLQRADRIASIEHIRNWVNQIRIAAWKSQAERDPKLVQEVLPRFDEIRNEAAVARQTMSDAGQLAELDAVEQAVAAYRAATDDMVRTSASLQETNRRRAEAGHAAELVSEQLADAALEHAGELSNSSYAAVSFGENSVMVGVAIAIAVAATLAFFIVRGITRPLTRIINHLSDGAHQVTEAAGQVAQTSQTLASGASQQAAALEETSASLEEVSATAQKNAETAGQAAEFSEQARTAAQTGDRTMSSLNDAMSGINDASGQISRIIKVIEEIAFQTNLLALNAAVEAARAGEHGKGFAVVAEEVRNLARRAADAAKETTTLIETCVERAGAGARIVGEVSEALSRIVTSSNQVSELIESIAGASREQATGVSQVGSAVSQMDKVTQSNAAGAEESASAAEQLSAQAASVQAVVNELAGMVHGPQGRPAAAPAVAAL